VLRRPFSLRISDTGGSGVFHARFSGKERTYPLPCTIRCEKGDPVIIVEEGLDRYALDSARAEYGRRGPDEQEAVMALAHLIRARYHYRKNAAHRGHDFCDLTHCQVYRGRTGPGRFPERGRVIDETRLEGNLFFHSCCGGRTLGPAVFRGKGAGYTGVRDRLFREGVTLCAGRDNTWNRSISSAELCSILFPGRPDLGGSCMEIIYKRESPGRVRVKGRTGSVTMAPEAFRLAVNRQKGWSFIRSNNYRVLARDNENGRAFIFSGRGLGHGAGLCQQGALELSRRGYSRFEILEHYFPGIRFRQTVPDSLPAQVSYLVFSLRNGTVINSSSACLVKRRLPPGSFFKLVTSLYLACERGDLFREYMYNCTGRGHGPDMPERCWKREGHGRVGIEDALSGSCNLWFASLCTRIDGQRFRSFFMRMKQDLDLDAVLTQGQGRADLAKIYSGLDFGITVSVSDIMKVLMVTSPGVTEQMAVMEFRKGVPQHAREKIFRALSGTFINGTGSAGDDERNRAPEDRDLPPVPDGMWGKTSTVIDGTNMPVAYGIFSGGIEDTGIIVLMKGGNGHFAAMRALEIIGSAGKDARVSGGDLLQ